VVATLRAFLVRLEPFADPALALVVFGLSIQPLLTARDCGCDPAPDWGFVLVAAQCLPIAVRRRWPLPTTLVIGALTTWYGLSSLPDPPVEYAGLIALYTVAAHASKREARFAAGVAVVAIAISFTVDADHADYQDYTVVTATFATAYLLGESSRNRRDRAAELEERAAQLERTRVAEAETAVVAERNRIARELHDAVAHHVSVMVVQAEAGPVAVRRNPERAVEAFDTISVAGKQALTEMRQMLGVLKTERGLREPQPGVEEIPDLVAGAVAAGLDVELTAAAEPGGPLPLTLSLAAYRVVQESLTNCLRHAPSAHVVVKVEYGETVDIDILDDGSRGTPGRWKERSPDTGNGLVAMRERVGLVGGSLTIGPTSEGGWRVHAVLPRTIGSQV
jgi:signal transduction histidine kinase